MGFDAVGGATGALSGAATGAKIGSVIPGVGTAVGAIAGGLIGLIGGGKKAKGPTYQGLDINKIISDARTAASTNLASSLALEQQYLPRTAALRVQTDNLLSGIAKNATPGLQAQQQLLAGLTGPASDIYRESASRVLNELKLGGALGAETQNAVMRGALEGAGAAGIAGSGAARGLAARDLGLTSLQLLQQRLQNASGVVDQGINLAAAGNQAGQIDLQRGNLLAGIIDSRALPESGLSAGSIADLYVADNNARNQVNATAATIAAGQKNATLQGLLGLGSMASTGGFDALGSIFAKTPTAAKTPVSLAKTGTAYSGGPASLLSGLY